jgi:hypothetical protein
MKNILITVFLGLCVSCTTQKESNGGIAVSLSEMKNSLTDTVYFKSSRILPLETNDNSLLKKINRICNQDDKFFVLDKYLNKIVVFDTDGKYINHIQRIGNGPAEYESIMDFCLDPVRKRILLLCDRPYKIMEFNYSGEFIREGKVDGLYFNIITDSEYIYCNKPEMRMSSPDEEYELICLNMDFNLIAKNLDSRENMKSNVVFQGNHLNTTMNNYYTRRFDNTIYQLTKGEITEKYSIDFGKNTFPVDLLKKDEKNFSDIAGGKQYVYSINDVSESEHYLCFNTNIGIFIIDKKNNIAIGHKTIYNSKIQLSSNTYFSIGNNPRMIASRIEPSILHQIKKESKNYSDYDNPALLELAEKVKEDDNPLLILYEFK